MRICHLRDYRRITTATDTMTSAQTTTGVIAFGSMLCHMFREIGTTMALCVILLAIPCTSYFMLQFCLHLTDVVEMMIT